MASQSIIILTLEVAGNHPFWKFCRSISRYRRITKQGTLQPRNSRALYYEGGLLIWAAGCEYLSIRWRWSTPSAFRKTSGLRKLGVSHPVDDNCLGIIRCTTVQTKQNSRYKYLGRQNVEWAQGQYLQGSPELTKRPVAYHGLRDLIV